MALCVDPLARDAVDADIDDDGAGLDPGAPDHFGPADGGHHHIGATDRFGEIAGARMGDGDGGVARQQQLRHRLADDVGAADDDRLGAGERPVQGLRGAVDQHHAAGRRAGHERALQRPRRQQAGVERVKTVNVLARIDGLQHLFGVYLPRQRQLHEDAVDGRIGVERGDKAQQFGLAGRRRQIVLHGMKAAGRRHLRL